MFRLYFYIEESYFDNWNFRTLMYKRSNTTHLSNQYERYESQYTFVNPFETDLTNYLKSIFIMILRPHGSSFEIFDFEIEAFTLK